MQIKKILLTILASLFIIAIYAQTEKYSDKFNLNQLEKGRDFLSDALIVKLNKTHKDFFQGKNFVENFIINDIKFSAEKMFPNKLEINDIELKKSIKLVDLSGIYIITLKEAYSIEDALDRLINTGYFQYVEPYYIPQFLYTPNDPLINNQYYLGSIQAYDAWDISLGDTNIVIGIVDSGTDTTHPDLYSNIKFNYDDPIDGIDNDNDGFIDNYYGWNIGEGNNNPQYNHPHGLHLSGIAAAKADNGTGIAGVGFNSKFLPIKATDEFGYLTKAYQGVVYAADKNCKVINCSWGIVGGIGQFGQDIVNYATFNRGALVVAAAGNLNNEYLYYPASYENVLSVAATEQNDIKWSGSTYNVHVDLCAPGFQIYSTWENGSYKAENGTSMAAPIVAGAAAIVAAHFPAYHPIQIAHLLKVTADIIDTIPANMPYANKLGSGRLNLYKALTLTGIPSVNMVSLNFSSEEIGQFQPGDTVYLSGNFVNYLDPTTNLKCTLTSLSPYISVLDSVIQFPSVLNTWDTVNSLSFPFRIKLNSNLPVSTKADFKLTFSDVSYTNKQYFSETFNVDYLIIDTNKVKTTFTSKSRIGYNNELKTQGIGLLYENSSLSQLAFGGLILGTSATQVSDNIYGNAPGSINNLFKNSVKAHRVNPSVVSDFHASAVFNDSLAGVNALNVEVVNNMYAWDNPQDEKFLITEYFIINKGQNQLVNFYAGLFMDWDIAERANHRSDFNQNLKMGYSYSTQGSYYAALKLLSAGNYRFYAFDNLTGIKIKDGFTNFEKYNALRTNKFQGGAYNADNDIMNLLSTGPFSVNPGDTVKIAFAIIMGYFLTDIEQVALAAQNKYNSYINHNQEIEPHKDNFFLYPNPSKDKLFIYSDCVSIRPLYLELYDNIGKLVYAENINMFDGFFNLNISSFKSGIYLLKLTSEDETVTHKLVVY